MAEEHAALEEDAKVFVFMEEGVAFNAACTFGRCALLRFGGGFHLLRSQSCSAWIKPFATSVVGGATCWTSMLGGR